MSVNEVSVLVIFIGMVFWVFTFFRYGQIQRLAYLHKVATSLGFPIRRESFRQSLDGLGDRRMAIMYNLITGAAFVTGAGAIILKGPDGNTLVDPALLSSLISVLYLLIAWGACNEAGASHTFYELALTSRNFSRSGSHISRGEEHTKRIKEKGLDTFQLGRLAGWERRNPLDFLWANTISTHVFLLFISVALLGWWMFLILPTLAMVVIGICLAYFSVILFFWGYRYELNYKRAAISSEEQARVDAIQSIDRDFDRTIKASE